jgi:hypothetical protein
MDLAFFALAGIFFSFPGSLKLTARRHPRLEVYTNVYIQTQSLTGCIHTTFVLAAEGHVSHT